MMTQTAYTSDLEERVESWVKAKIAPNRLKHVAGVVETADRLARQYAPDSISRARLAGWIHDVAKHWTDDQLLEYAESHHIPITDGERLVPQILHGRVGYELAADVFGFNDLALCTACAYHTTGDVSMNTLDKIVYLADLIEPTRNFPGVDQLRQEIKQDLDVALLHAVDMTLSHLINKQKIIDPRPLDLRNLLLSQGIRYER